MVSSAKLVNLEVQLQVLDLVNQLNQEALMVVEKEDGCHTKLLGVATTFLPLLQPPLEVRPLPAELDQLD